MTDLEARLERGLYDAVSKVEFDTALLPVVSERVRRKRRNRLVAASLSVLVVLAASGLSLGLLLPGGPAGHPPRGLAKRPQLLAPPRLTDLPLRLRDFAGRLQAPRWVEIGSGQPTRVILRNEARTSLHAPFRISGLQLFSEPVGQQLNSDQALLSYAHSVPTRSSTAFLLPALRPGSYELVSTPRRSNSWRLRITVGPPACRNGQITASKAQNWSEGAGSYILATTLHTTSRRPCVVTGFGAYLLDSAGTPLGGLPASPLGAGLAELGRAGWRRSLVLRPGRALYLGEEFGNPAMVEDCGHMVKSAWIVLQLGDVRLLRPQAIGECSNHEGGPGLLQLAHG